MLSLICLSFIQLNSVNQISHPNEVVKTLKSRLSHQWQSQKSGLTLDFENSDCAFQGTYFFNDDQVVLSADHEQWKGRLEINFTELLEGKSIEFDKVRPHKFRTDSLPTTITSQSSNSKWKKWIPWTLAIAGAATATYLLIDRENQIKKMKGLSVSF